MSEQSNSEMQLQHSATIKAKAEALFSFLPLAITMCTNIPGLPDDRSLRTVCEVTLGGRFFAGNDDFSKRLLFGTVTGLEQNKLVRLAGPFNLDGRCMHAVVTILFEAAGEETRVTITQQDFGATDDELHKQWSNAWLGVLGILRDEVSGFEEKKVASESDANTPYPNYFVNLLKEFLVAFQEDVKRGDISQWLEIVLKADDLTTAASEAAAKEMPKLIERRKAARKDAGEKPDEAMLLDPHMKLEQTYQDLQSELIQVRQAVAWTIANQKQLELQVQKHKDQAATWQNRADTALEQKNADLAGQALQRKEQYAVAAAEIEKERLQQIDSCTALRQKLTDLEAAVQRAYTKKQVLIARDKAATASIKAEEILAQLIRRKPCPQ